MPETPEQKTRREIDADLNAAGWLSFLIGLTATPAGKTIGFFNQNLVMHYGHNEAVTDGVNVDFDVYSIRTRIRHPAISLLLNSVADPFAVQKLAGNSDVRQTTQTYAHVQADALWRAVGFMTVWIGRVIRA